MAVMTIPTDSAELAEFLADDKKLDEMFKPENRSTKFPEFLTNYVKAHNKKDPSVAEQVRIETNKVLADWIKENGQTDLPIPKDFSPTNNRLLPSGQKAKHYNKKAPGAKLDGVYSDAAEYFQAIWHKTPENQSDYARELVAKSQKARQIQNAYGSIVPADGGFLIPEVLRSELLMWALEQSIVRPRATVIPMDSLRVPIPMVDSTTNVGSVFGGIVAYWTEEGAALTESSASFGQVVLDAKKLTAYATVPNELVQDAPAFEGFFEQAFPSAIAFYEDYAFMQGTGAGEPLGFVNNPAVATVAAQAGQPTATILWENIVGMYARMMPTSLGRACWIASIDTFPQLATMALSVGTGGSAVWLANYQNSGDAAPPMSILGRPVYFTEKTPPLGTTGDISFVDLSYYLIGDRQIMQAASSPHFQFNQDKTAFRVVERIDGRPWLQSAITPKNNSANTLSPFVQLATRP